MTKQTSLLNVLANHPPLSQIVEALSAHGEGRESLAQCPTCQTSLVITDLPEAEWLSVTCGEGCCNYREHRNQNPPQNIQWVDSLNEANFVSCNLSRQTIETQDLTRVLRNLRELVKDAEHVRKFQDRLIVTVDGYNDDPRPLWYIAEVRECLRLLDEQFPYWFHFCEKEGGTLRMLALCLMPLIETADGAISVSFGDFSELLQARSAATLKLHKMHKLELTITQSNLEVVVNYYEEQLWQRKRGE